MTITNHYRRPGTELESIGVKEIIVNPDSKVVTHPPQESTERDIKSFFSSSSQSESTVKHLLLQTTSIPQTSTTSFIGDVNISAYVRKQKIDFAVHNMRPNRKVYGYFDGKNVTNLIQKPNIVELDNSKAYIGINPVNIKRLDTSNSANPIISSQVDLSRSRIYFGNTNAVFADVYFAERTSTGNTRLYISEIVSDNVSYTIQPGDAVRSQVAGSSIRSNVVSYIHNSGIIRFSYGTLTVNATSNVYFTSFSSDFGAANTLISKKAVKLARDASSEDDWYIGNTITVVNGFVPGETCNIVSYNGATRTAIVEPAIKSVIGEGDFIYTIGDYRDPAANNVKRNSLYTTSKGFFGGSLYIPSPKVTSDLRFRVGEKLLKISDDPDNRSENATTIAEYIYNTFGLTLSKGQLVINYYSNAVSTTAGSSGSLGVQGTPLPITPPAFGEQIILTSEGEVDVTPPIKSIKINPIAQTFTISDSEYPQGIFVPYVDLFFAQKGTLGVELQIRPVINGYPDAKNIVPNAISFLEAEDVVVSDNPSVTDPNTYTRFTFNSPIYLFPGEEYALVLSTNDYDYSIYGAELGERIIGTERLVSQQPYSGALFKSQNSSTYEPIMSEDLMFVIHKCQFISSGHIRFNEYKEEAKEKALFDNYYDSNTRFDSFEIHSNLVELPRTNVSFGYKATTLDSMAMDAEYNVIRPDRRILVDNRKIAISKNIPTNSFDLRLDLTTTSRDISPIIFKNAQKLYTAATLINNMGLRDASVRVINPGTKYTTQNTSVTIVGNSEVTANARIINLYDSSPRLFNEPIDTGRIGGIFIDQDGSGYFDNVGIQITSTDGSGAELTIESETNASGGPAIARYISKTVTLSPEFEAGDLRVFLTAIRPTEGEIAVYYKVKNPYDEEDIDNKNWIRMERKTGKKEFSDGFTPIEFEYRPSMTSNNIVYSTTTATFDSFNQFKLKIVLASSSTSLAKIPYVYDMRAVALPADTF